MMVRFLFLFGWLFFGLGVSAQGWNPVGARSNSLSGASVTLTDVWAVHQNPGAVARIKAFSVGMYYDTRFMTKELQNQAIAAALPLKRGVIMTGAQLFGYEQYRHTRAGLGYALQLSEKFSAGVQGNIQYLRLGNNYGSSISATAEAGFLARFTDKWDLGFSITNIGRQRISSASGELEDRFNSVMRLGSSYSPSDKVKVIGEIQKDVIYPITFRGAIEYLPIKQVAVRLGAQTGPANFSFGFGYVSKSILLDFGSKYHQQLGWSPHIGFTYLFAKDEK